MARRFTALVLVAGSLAVAASLACADVTVTVRDAQGHPLPGAGVAVYAGAPPTASEPAVMDQIHEQFVPDFLVVRTGTAVSFPNSDQVLHHVYSFSPAKVFELPLYKGVLPSPIRFDREGIVVIGCNIHDHMIGHIWVVDAPLHATTDAYGRAHFEHLAAGDVRVLAWHPRAGRDGVREAYVDVAATGDGAVDVSLAVAKPTTEQGALSWHDSY